MALACAVKYVGKLEDGTVFEKKGHDGDELFEFVNDEGLSLVFTSMALVLFYRLQCFLGVIVADSILIIGLVGLLC